MVTREAFVAEVRSWIGTPYQHQGRIKGVAVDCGGLVVGAGQALGLTEFDMQGYGRYPDGSLQPLCEEHLQRVMLHEVGLGDVVLFQWEARPSHLGIVTGPDLIVTHAYIMARKVVEHRLDAQWLSAVAGFYHFPGLER